MTDVLVTGDLTVEGIVTGGSSGSTSLKIAVLSDQRPSGTNGGDSLTNNYCSKPVNTVVDPHNLIDFDEPNGRFKINEPGTYYIEAFASTFRTNRNKLVLADWSNNVALTGTSCFNLTSGEGGHMSYIQDILIVTPETVKYRVLHYTERRQTINGLGHPTSQAGLNELYMNLTIIKISD